MAISGNSVSVVIPTYQAGNWLREVVKEVVEELGENLLELIIVDDGSTQVETRILLRDIASVPLVEVVFLSKNFGQHSAVLAGLRRAKGEFVLMMDDDGQCPTPEIETLLQAMRSDIDLVFGVYDKKAHSLMKRFGSRLHDSLLQSAFKLEPSVRLSNFALMRQFIAVSTSQFMGPKPYLAWLFLNRTSRIASVQVSHRPSLRGKSNYSLLSSLFMWIDFALTVAVVPAKALLILGVMASLLGLSAGVWTVAQALTGGLLPGFPSILASLLFFGGLQSFFAGLSLEYLGRADRGTSGQPQSLARGEFNTFSRNGE